MTLRQQRLARAVQTSRDTREVRGASGYADLLAKLTAGADWMLADALGTPSSIWRCDAIFLNR